jgi:tetratricopeptide (TPR) repeat protein
MFNFDAFRKRRTAKVVLWVLVGMLAVGLLGSTVAWYLTPDQQAQEDTLPPPENTAEQPSETAGLEALLEQYEEMYAEKPDDLSVLTGYARLEFQLGDLYLRQGKENEGREHCEKAKEFFIKALAIQEDTNLRLELAVVCQTLGEFDQAEAELGRILAKEPKNAQALLQRGFLRESKEDWRGAAADWKALLALPDLDDATRELVRSQLKSAEEKIK